MKYFSEVSKNSQSAKIQFPCAHVCPPAPDGCVQSQAPPSGGTDADGRVHTPRGTLARDPDFPCTWPSSVFKLGDGDHPAHSAPGGTQGDHSRVPAGLQFPWQLLTT